MGAGDDVTLRVGADAGDAQAAINTLSDGVKALGSTTSDTAAGGVSSLEGGLTSLTNGFSELAGALGIGLSIGALVSFGEKVVADGEHIEYMARTLGVSEDAIQRWSYAIEQSGGQLDSVTNAVTFMNKNLTDDTPKASKAIADLGLSVRDLRAMSPDEAFNAIATAIQKVPDPMRQSADALDIFGRGAKDILPAIKAGMQEVGDQAPIMSTATIKALADIDRDWKTLKSTIEVVTSETLVAFIDLITHPLAFAQNAMTLQVERMNSGFVTFGGTIDGTQAKLGVDLKNAWDKATKSTTDGVGAIDLSTSAYLKFAPPAAAATEETKAHQKAIQALVDTYDGMAVKRKIDDITEAVTQAGGASHITAFETDALGKQLIELVKQGGTVPPILQGIYDKAVLLAQETQFLSLVNKDSTATVLANADGHANLKSVLEASEPVWDMSSIKVRESLDGLHLHGTEVKLTTDKIGPDGLQRALKDLARSFDDLERVAGPSFATIVRGAADVVVGLEKANQVTTQWAQAQGSAAKAAVVAGAATNVAAGAVSIWTQSANQGSDAANVLHGAMAGAEAGSHYTIFGAAIGFIAGAVVGLVRNMTEGRRAVDDFAKSMGGFDALHTQLDALGASGEAMWVKLTQGIAKGDLKGAQAEIALIQAAFSTAAGQADLFMAALSQGGPVAANAVASLDKQWTQFVKDGTDGAGLLNKQLVDLASREVQLGEASATVAKYRADQAASAEKGIAASVKVSSDAYTAQQADLVKLADLQTQLAAATDDAQRKTIQAAIQATNADLETQRRILAATSIQSQDEATAVADAEVAAVNAKVAAGETWIQAVLDQKSEIIGLRDELTQTGTDGGAAFDLLTGEVDLATNKIAGPALTAMEGYTQAVVGLNNSGNLTADMYKGLESRIGTTALAIENEGFSHAQVMAAMQNDLQVAWELQEKFPGALDDTTQALVDEAAAAGVVGETHKSTADQMLDATKLIATAVAGIAKAFGVDVPNSLDTLRDRSKSVLDGIKTQVSQIPTSVTIDVNGVYNPPDIPDAGSPGDGSTPPSSDWGGGIVGDQGVQYLAKGKFPGRPSGTDQFPAWLSFGEGVVSAPGMKMLEWLNHAIAPPPSAAGSLGMGGGVSIGSVPIHVDATQANFTDPSAVRRVGAQMAQEFLDVLVRKGVPVTPAG